VNLKLTRIYETGIHTCGLLQYGGHIWTALEDAHHDRKIPGKTRIPAGTYDLNLRTTSPMASRYRERFGKEHAGMIWLRDVPNYDYVYIHIGNIAEDSRGCILVGRTMSPQQGFIGESKAAYEELYPLIMDGLANNARASIEIVDACV